MRSRSSARRTRLYVTDRVVGADPAYALPVRTITDRALTALFADNMFRPVPADIEKSVFADRAVHASRRCRTTSSTRSATRDGCASDPATGKTSDMAIAMDFDRRIGVVYGSAYCGSVKKLIFTVMNYLPAGRGHPAAPLLGERGTRRATSPCCSGSRGPARRRCRPIRARALLGDDEHGWSDDGVANFENGCYAKLINLDPEKEPEIYNARASTRTTASSTGRSSRTR